MSIRHIDRLNDSQIKDLLRMYKSTYWANDRKEEDVREMLHHTPFVFGLCDSDSGRLVAFARVVTDFVYKAVLFDVVVDKEYQKRGLGKMLLDTVTHHPVLSKVQHIDLYCKEDVIPFYERWGFQVQMNEMKWMRKERK